MDEASLAKLGVDARRLGRVEAALHGDIASGRIYGAAMRVSRRGQMILDFLGGHADKEAAVPLQRDSVFITLSVAKPMTHVLVLSLVEKGLLRLHAPVAEIIPEFTGFGKENVTLLHVLTHTAGLVPVLPPVGPEIWANIEKLTQYLCAAPLASVPGERVSYSMIVATSLLAAMCLRVDGRGRNYATMMAQDLFEPLGMTETSLGSREDLVPRLCPLRLATDAPHNTIRDDMNKYFESVILNPGAECPAAGILTTLDDVHRFTEMLRRGGELDGTRILSPAMLKFCARNFTGAMRNNVWDSVLSARHWQPFPADLGIGFFVRGEGVYPNRFGLLASPGSFGGFGAGSGGTWVDPQNELSFSFLSAGLLEETYHVERTGVLSDLVLSALVD